MPGLHHLEINVSDREMGRSWRLASPCVVLVQTGDEFLGVPYDRRRVGLNHVAFWADSRDPVDEITIGLEERGATVLYRDRHPYAGGPEHYAVYAEDADRIKLEVVAPA